MSEAAMRLLARAFILGWRYARTDTPWPGWPDGENAQAVVSFLFQEHQTIVTREWVNDLVGELKRGLQQKS